MSAACSDRLQDAPEMAPSKDAASAGRNAKWACIWSLGVSFSANWVIARIRRIRATNCRGRGISIRSRVRMQRGIKKGFEAMEFVAKISISAEPGSSAGDSDAVLRPSPFFLSSAISDEMKVSLSEG